MYLMGQGSDVIGPGTSLVQRINWTQAQENQMRGMGCAGRGMGCAGLGCRGLGCGGGCGNDIRGKCSGTCAGLGLFDTGLDYTGWGFPEYTVVGLVGYMVLSTLMTTKRAARSIHGTVSGAYRGAQSGARDANTPRRAKRR
jgi:hypothetical protein